MRHCGSHSSMLCRNGSHISAQVARNALRWKALNYLRKNSSSVSFLRSWPNYNGKLLTTVTNFQTSASYPERSCQHPLGAAPPWADLPKQERYPVQLYLRLRSNLLRAAAT